MILVLAVTLTLSMTSYVPSSRGVTGETNVVTDPGFEDPSGSCGGWTTSITGNGTARACDPTFPHTGSHSALLNATKAPPGVGASRDAVRVAVQEDLFSGPSPYSLDSLSNSGNSFSAWWYVNEPTQYGMIGTYSLHAGITFYDTNSAKEYFIEYWYGVSDLANNTIGHSLGYRLGDLQTRSWFQMARNLTLDMQPLNIPNLSKTKVYGIWFGAYGNTTYGERAYLDDASLLFLSHPVPVFSANPAVGVSPLTVSFDASASGETSGGSGIRITDYKWSFGDGSPDVTGASSKVSHTYNGPGEFVVVLTVTDSNGQTGSIFSRISVSPDNSWLGPVVAGSLGVILIAGVFLLRGRSRARKTRDVRRRFRK